MNAPFASVTEWPASVVGRVSINVLAWPMGTDLSQLPDPLPRLLPQFTRLNTTHFLPRHFGAAGMTAVEEVYPTLEAEFVSESESEPGPPQPEAGQVRLWWHRNFNFFAILD